MTLQTRLEELRSGLEASSPLASDSIFEATVDELEDVVLSEAEYPAPVLEFFMTILRDPKLYSKKGASRIPMSVYNDRDKLSPGQAHCFAEVIQSGYKNYRDEMLCLTASDFIARALSDSDALKALQAMASQAESRPGLAALMTALNALACRLSPNDERISAIRSVFADVQRKNGGANS